MSFSLNSLVLSATVLLFGGLACQRTPELQTFPAAGVVKSVSNDNKRAVIAHEDVPGFMQAMTMEFEVKDSTLLADIFPEDAVTFTIEQTPDSLYIIAIENETADPQVFASHIPGAPATRTPKEEQEEFAPFRAPGICRL